MPKDKEQSRGDIYRLLLESSEKQRKSSRARLLGQLKVKEFFEEGSIRIEARTCQGLECELCIKACPTKALYWQDGKVGILEDLCVYCGACVLCCIVDDCIRITRKRLDGKMESFSKPIDVIQICNSSNSRMRHKRVIALFPDQETYLKRYRKM